MYTLFHPMQRRLKKLLPCIHPAWAIAWCINLQTYATPVVISPQATDTFEQAMTLFEHHHYEAAQAMLEKYKAHDPIGIEATYYSAICALRLGRNDGEAQLQHFITTYPHHRKTNWAYYELGNLYAQQQAYDHAIASYQKVDTTQLSPALYAALHYHWGYAYLNEKDFEQALQYFNTVKNTPSAYGSVSNYYAGYLSLKKSDYETALQDLRQAEKDPAYQPVISSLILEIYYQKNQFEELITYGDQILFQQPELNNQADIHFLLAEAHFYLRHYPAAIQHYETYLGLQPAEALPAVYYRLGYALYCQGELAKALTHFQAIALQDNELAQMASYYMGLTYLKMNQKNQALLAFDHAQKLSFAPDIQQEATFQYAQLCCEVGNAKTAIETLQTFKQAYPHHARIPSIDKLLTQLYFNSHNYEQTISYIEGLPNRPNEILRLYQQATFYKGTACFNQESYESAINWLQKSLSAPFDTDLMLQSRLWIAESWAAQQAYEEAAQHYHTVLSIGKKNSPTYQQALYGLAYVYFNTNRHQQALTHFQAYTRQTNEKQDTWYLDAQVRTADCYYMLQSYANALAIYHTTEKQYPAHSQYQAALIYDIQGNYQQAQDYIGKVITYHAQTPYYEKALFAQAKMALKYQKYPEAVKGFTLFLEKKPYSSLVPAALLNRALAQTNQQHTTEACADYEQLVTNYPTDPAAQGAILELSRLLVETGQSDRLQSYLEKYKSANPTSQTVETIQFEAAKNLLYTQHYTKAIEQLEAFIHTYPTSSFTKEANFLLAETYYRLGKETEALVQYTQAYNDKPTPFYNKILLRLATLSYKKDDFTSALSYYHELYEQATNKKEAYYALEGKMKSGAALRAYGTVQEAASQILAAGDITINATNQAKIYLGKAALEEKKIQEALGYFRQIANKDQGPYGAEAQYYIAHIHHQLGDYKLSLEDLFTLQKNFSNYTEWLNKGFFLIVENYIALQELFQARATLQSIIDHATDPTIVEQAHERLQQLEQQALIDSTTLASTNEKALEDDTSKTIAEESKQPETITDSTFLTE